MLDPFDFFCGNCGLRESPQERFTRHRRTVNTKIAQLQADRKVAVARIDRCKRAALESKQGGYEDNCRNMLRQCVIDRQVVKRLDHKEMQYQALLATLEDVTSDAELARRIDEINSGLSMANRQLTPLGMQRLTEEFEKNTTNLSVKSETLGEVMGVQAGEEEVNREMVALEKQIEEDVENEQQLDAMLLQA